MTLASSSLRGMWEELCPTIEMAQEHIGMLWLFCVPRITHMNPQVSTLRRAIVRTYWHQFAISAPAGRARRTRRMTAAFVTHPPFGGNTLSQHWGWWGPRVWQWRRISSTYSQATWPQHCRLGPVHNAGFWRNWPITWVQDSQGLQDFKLASNDFFGAVLAPLKNDVHCPHASWCTSETGLPCQRSVELWAGRWWLEGFTQGAGVGLLDSIARTGSCVTP